jgi:PAS domain S-box-containing protein
MSEDVRQYLTTGVFVREIDQSVDALRRTVSDRSRGLSLQTEAEWMGGFGIAVWDLETNEMWLSEGVYRIFGMRRMTTLSQLDLMLTVVHPKDLEAVRARSAAGIEGGVFDSLHRIVRPDGEVRHVHAKGQRIEASDGHSPILLISIVDVTPST